MSTPEQARRELFEILYRDRLYGDAQSLTAAIEALIDAKLAQLDNTRQVPQHLRERGP